MPLTPPPELLAAAVIIGVTLVVVLTHVLTGSKRRALDPAAARAAAAAVDPGQAPGEVWVAEGGALALVELGEDTVMVLQVGDHTATRRIRAGELRLDAAARLRLSDPGVGPLRADVPPAWRDRLGLPR